MNYLTRAAQRGFEKWLVGLLLTLCGSIAAGQNAVQSVSASMQGGVEVVRIEFAQPLTALPASFAVQTPARIALDFPGVSNAMGRSSVEINQGNLRSVNVVEAGDRTRVVLNLKAAAGYKPQLQGRAVLVVLDSAASAGPTPAGAPVLPRTVTGTPCLSRTSTSVVVLTIRAGWWWILRTIRSASISGNKARRWLLSSSSHRCLKACAGVWMSPISARLYKA